MKRFDLTLATLLASVSLPALAAAQSQPAQTVPAECAGEACTARGEVLLRLRSVGDQQPVTRGTDERSSSSELQADRRADIYAPAQAPSAPAEPGRADVAGRFGIDLPNGGRIWAVEDPNPGVPEMAISASGLVPFDGERVIKPVTFMIRTNYPSFVDRMEISIYRGTDIDLVRPLAVLPVEPAAITQVDWDGQMSSDRLPRVGDELIYVLRAFSADGARDETYRARLQLARPEDVDRQLNALRTTYERATGITGTVEQALGRSLTDNVFSGNGLRLQNIPINASRVRIMGSDVPTDRAVTINGENYPVDQQGKLAAEFLMPLGRHTFDIGIGGRGQPQTYRLDTDLDGKYFFAVAIADVTIQQNDVSTSGQASIQQREDDILTDGRLAFYLKSRFKERYLLTAQMDTTERELDRLFNDFGRAYPYDIFRRLDPDMYYPTYGDDSTVYRDVDTMGRFYLRMDWDKNQAVWGNYQTDLEGTEFAQYTRSLYGGALRWRSEEANRWGEAVTQVRAFGSEAQTLPGRNEFLGTGGSLYYLRNTDILPGSEQVVVEVIDPVSGRSEARVPLLRGVDYEIDHFQGRLILTRPLAQITRANTISISRNTPLEGMTQKLTVDYEWVPSGFDADGMTWGLRGKHWFGDHIGVGATYVDEDRAGQDYTLFGADVTLRAGEGTYLKAEYAETESLSAPSFFSSNGGLSFQPLGTNNAQSGDAKSVEGRVNLNELGLTSLNWTAGAWWRETTNGYSTSLYPSGEPLEQYGAEVLGELSPSLELYMRYARNRLGQESLTQAQALLDWRLDVDNSVTAEVRRVEEKTQFSNGTGVLGALRYTRRLKPGLEVFGQAQLTLDDDGGAYADNDRYMLGAQYQFGDRSTVGAEVSTGDRGDAATLNAEYRLGNDRTIYGSYTTSPDTLEYHPVLNPVSQNGWTIGQRSRLSNRLSLFNESQYIKEPNRSGLAHTVGLDFYPGRGWTTGLTIQDGELTNEAGGKVDRFAISGRLGHTSPRTEWQSRIEWRQDKGAEQREQWVTTNRIHHKINESWRVAGRFNYSETEDQLNPAQGAKFIEGNAGFAYRPWDNSRWGVFGRYSYLHDMASAGQFGGAQYDQKTQILSMEGVYQFDQRWEVAAKAARRIGEVRMQRGQGQWFESDATLLAGQLRYDLRNRWHALAEYRHLSVDNGGTRQGFLVGVDRDLTKNFRIGVGYNFTEFSDDLTNFEYDHRGWFINLVGYY
ncbi:MULTISPECIES: outer membrane protein [unclassified Brevundimonas]|uniref:outer membrane protein n=1 Tax=unclassified Brevundimonas TaxID=2622653 RepID=UPI0025B8BEEB|nr:MULTISPECIES: TonB-dependent receptor [unclassified Brevundimonas]